jgi:hypothetical protein
MADFDDVPLQRSPVDDSPRPRAPRVWLVVVGAVVLAAFGAWYYWGRSPRPAATDPRPAVRVDKATVPLRTAEPGEDIPLPPLGETDPLVRQLVSALSSHPRVAAWLTTDGLIRNFTVATHNIGDGRAPSRHLKAVAPDGAFQVRTEGGRSILDPRSYQRYDGHADAVGGLDAKGTARLYATLEPRIEEAHRELGGRDDFDAALERAIVALLSTPIVEGTVRLDADGGVFKFNDPALESLTPVQRQFLRMGPRNMRIVQAKLREIAGHLGIDPARLPPERVHAR